MNKADTGARSVLLDNAVSDSKLNERIDTDYHFTVERAAGAPPRLLVLGMAIVALGVGLPALGGQPQAKLIDRKDAGGPTPMVLAQVDEKAIEEKIDRLWEQAKSEQASGEYLEALVTVGEALGLSPDSAELLAFRDELVTQHEAELNTQRDDNQVSGLADLAREEIAAGDYAGAQDTIARGLHIAPSDAALIELNEQVMAALEAEADDAQQAAAEQEGNVRESALLAAEARDALANSELDTAQEKLTKALALTPEDETLLALETEIKTAQAEADSKAQLEQQVAEFKDEATSLLEQGEYEAALEKLTKALELAPTNTKLAELATSIEAQLAAEQERQRIANQVDELEQKAQTALDSGDFDQAQQHVQAALELTPEAASALALKNEIDDAAQAAAEGERNTREAESLATEARDALAAEQLDTAQEKLTQALALSPDDGNLLALRKEIETARAEAQAQEQLRQQVAALKDEATVLHSQGDYGAAQAKIAEAIELAPENSELLALGKTIEEQHSAEQEQQRIAAEVSRLRGQAANELEQGELDSALASANQALVLAPEDADLIALRDEITSKQQAALEQQRIDQQVSGLLQDAQAALDAGDLDRAQQQAQAALELTPTGAEALALQESIEEARRAAAESERITAEAEALAAEARDALAAEQYDTAQERLGQALALTPDDANLLALQKEVETVQAEAKTREQLRQQVAALKDEATTLQNQGEYDAALEKVAEARKLTADDSDLPALAKAIEKQRAAEQERQRIAAEVARLSEQARSQLDAGQFEGAAASVDEALTLAPEDSELSALREEISNRRQAVLEQERIDKQVNDLLQQAQKALDTGDLDQATQQVEAALDVAPQAATALALQQTVEEAQQAASERERIARESEALTTEAREALAAGQLDSAQERVTQALELTPDSGNLLALQKEVETARADAQAQERLRQQVAALKDEAATLQSQGDYAGALAKIAEATELTNDDSELAAITKSIETERAAEQERIEQVAAPYIRRGDDHLSRKDVASARLYYETAFSEGSVKAARLLGMTYDPVSIQELGIVGMRGDVEKALYWYEIARDAGDPEASQRMSTLKSQ